ncbi:putative SP-containing protein [Vairimorpha necatrix]|uniref:SP-containing protein n=1 Tax=Vairimorpha necatrix TaxID=6039 RepID=A0AAX4JF38_9MICR
MYLIILSFTICSSLSTNIHPLSTNYEWDYNQDGSKKIFPGQFGNLILKFKNENEKSLFFNIQSFVLNWAESFDKLTNNMKSFVNVIDEEVRNNRADKVLYDKIFNVLKVFRSFNVHQFVSSKEVQFNIDFKTVLSFHEYIKEKIEMLSDEMFRYFKNELMREYSLREISKEEIRILNIVKRLEGDMERIFGSIKEVSDLNENILEILKR